MTLYRRIQLPDPNGTGIIETDAEPVCTAALVEPTSPLTFYGSLAAGDIYSVTHNITVRWLPFVDKTDKIERVFQTPDGNRRTEIFRIIRVIELDDTLQFVSFETSLEQVVYS